MTDIDFNTGSLLVRFTPDGQGAYTYRTFVRPSAEASAGAAWPPQITKEMGPATDLGDWVPAANWPNALVGGGLELRPSTVIPEDGKVRLAGASEVATFAGITTCRWEGALEALPNGGVTFDLRVSVPDRLPIPPQIALWLGPLSVMVDRQGVTWRRTFIAGPVRNTEGLWGNDVPALYFRDPSTSIETLMAFDASQLSWEPSRLLALHCEELMDYGPEPRYGVGLTGAQSALEPGEYVFRWHLWQGHNPQAVSGWQAAERLTTAMAPTLAAQADGPAGASWGGIISDTVHDSLLPVNLVELTDATGTHLGQRAYADGTHQLYQHPRDHFELMGFIDPLTALPLYERLHPSADIQRITAGWLESLPLFHHPEVHYIGNRYPTHPGDRLCDTWNLFQNGLIRMSWIALANGRQSLSPLIEDAAVGSELLAEHMNYCFPLLADFSVPEKPTPVGYITNFGVAGAFSFGMLMADAVSGTRQHRAAARRALVALRSVPIELAYHTPQQLAFGAAAAALLADDGDAEMAEFAGQLVSAQLRLGYWQEDPHALAHGYRLRGLFHGCAAILYPAMMEQGLALPPWTFLLRRKLGPTELMLKFLNLGRRHGLYFLEPYHDKPKNGAFIAPGIPFENLGTTELPGTGSVGKELYGTGEVFWMYFLFEALARASDPDICVVYLDLLEPDTLRNFPPARRRFMVYNPTAAARDVHLTFHHLPAGQFTVAVSAGAAQPLGADAAYDLRLEAGGWADLDIAPVAG